MTGLLRLSGFLAALVLTACATTGGLQGPRTEPQEIFDALGAPQREVPRLRSRAPAVGPEAPYTPIMQPPVVQRVWVPDHLNAAGDLVSGHWVYLLLAPSRWFLETYPPSPVPPLRLPPHLPAGGEERLREPTRSTSPPPPPVSIPLQPPPASLQLTPSPENPAWSPSPEVTP